MFYAFAGLVINLVWFNYGENRMGRDWSNIYFLFVLFVDVFQIYKCSQKWHQYSSRIGCQIHFLKCHHICLVGLGFSYWNCGCIIIEEFGETFFDLVRLGTSMLFPWSIKYRRRHSVSGLSISSLVQLLCGMWRKKIAQKLSVFRPDLGQLKMMMIYGWFSKITAR